jgi:hypothetical protein
MLFLPGYFCFTALISDSFASITIRWSPRILWSRCFSAVSIFVPYTWCSPGTASCASRFSPILYDLQPMCNLSQVSSAVLHNAVLKHYIIPKIALIFTLSDNKHRITGLKPIYMEVCYWALLFMPLVILQYLYSLQIKGESNKEKYSCYIYITYSCTLYQRSSRVELITVLLLLKTMKPEWM